MNTQTHDFVRFRHPRRHRSHHAQCAHAARRGDALGAGPVAGAVQAAGCAAAPRPWRACRRHGALRRRTKRPHRDSSALPRGPGLPFLPGRSGNFFENHVTAFGLTRRPRHPMPIASVGRTAAPRQCRKAAGEESPGSMDERCRITSGGAGPFTGRGFRDSATENRPPRLRSVLAAVRVKRCGKSAPRLRQRRRHGKPHREQDRIGMTLKRKLRVRPGQSFG